MKKFVLLFVFLSFMALGDDAVPATPAPAPVPAKKHGFFHPLTHFFVHDVGNGLKKGAGKIHDAFAGKKTEKKDEKPADTPKTIAIKLEEKEK